MKRFGFVRLILCLGVLSFSVHEASATDVALVGDASVNSAHPSVNYGALSNLYVASGNTAFLQFDLSTLPTGTTSAQVSRATLTVFVNRVNTAGSVTVSPVTGSWGEYSVTSGTAPATGGSVGTLPISVGGQFISVDVTTQVQAWVNSPASNNGLALVSGGADVLFDSKENDETSHAARLDITLVNQGPQGIQGVPGVAGVAGAAGPIGPAGAQGLPGVSGPVGPIGPQGIQGIQGPLGPVGVAGPTGATGPQGPIGPTGLQGTTGAIGPAGPTGAVGPIGATGAQGPPVSFIGPWNGATPYSIGSAVSEGGTSYIALVANSAIDPATDVSGSGGHWAVLALAGTAGAAGPTGATGPAGPTGPIGATGATGPQGPAGGGGSHIFMANVILGQANSTTQFFSLNSSYDPSNVGTFLNYNQFATTYPEACTFDSMFLTSGQSGFGTFSSPITITLFKNGTATTLTKAITPPSTNTLASAQITGQSVSIAAGDTVALQATSTSFTTNGSFVPLAPVSVTLHCQ